MLLPRLALNLDRSTFTSQIAGITDTCYHASFDFSDRG
jgi:hypothetical protein